MNLYSATAQASPNIAFIKYWGNQDDLMRIPRNGSISMNLEKLFTITQVNFLPGNSCTDSLNLNGMDITGPALDRVSKFLDIVRAMAQQEWPARVTSRNNFPTGAGIASSASAFAALSLASSRAIGLNLDEKQLSRLARRGSGSASRSIPAGFSEWFAGGSDEDSYAISLAQPNHWELVDCICIVAAEEKKVGSTQGHATASTSPLQFARVDDALRRLDICRTAILQRDFDSFAEIVELDSNLMHSVMMTSSPPLFYWEPASLTLMKEIPTWRKEGLPSCYTLDAGPNVHVICPSEYATEVIRRLEILPEIQRVIKSPPGVGAVLIDPQP